MAEFELKVRRMKTGETLVASVGSLEEALQFLSERPEFMEVLGVLSDASPADRGRLKDAMRPYSEAELALKRELDAKADAAMREQMEREQLFAKAAEEQARKEALEADPDRPMVIQWDIDDGYRVGDHFDPRPITDEMKDAVAAWIAERNEWVKPRDQEVAQCRVHVYPGPVPDGEERVLAGGQFTPRRRDVDVS